MTLFIVDHTLGTTEVTADWMATDAIGALTFGTTADPEEGRNPQRLVTDIFSPGMWISVHAVQEEDV